jgi:hypothetical protein
LNFQIFGGSPDAPPTPSNHPPAGMFNSRLLQKRALTFRRTTLKTRWNTKDCGLLRKKEKPFRIARNGVF